MKILKEHPERVQALRDIANYMREGLKKAGVPIIDSITPIIPIYTYEVERTFLACKLLSERGVYVNSSIPPATPEGQCLIRTSYTATHTKEQMDKCIKAIAEVLQMLPPLQNKNEE